MRLSKSLACSKDSGSRYHTTCRRGRSDLSCRADDKRPGWRLAPFDPFVPPSQDMRRLVNGMIRGLKISASGPVLPGISNAAEPAVASVPIDHGTRLGLCRKPNPSRITKHFACAILGIAAQREQLVWVSGPNYTPVDLESMPLMLIPQGCTDRSVLVNPSFDCRRAAIETRESLFSFEH
jgi:hypothetical protein